MLLPTDNQTEGVVITDAPASTPTPYPPDIASGPGFMPFTPIFRERSLWLAMLISLAILLLMYQFFTYTYVGTRDWWYFNTIGTGWHSQSIPRTGDYWTSSAGTIYFRNLGYPFADRNLIVFVAAYDNPAPAFTHTIAISVGSQTVLTLEARDLADKEVTVSAALLRAAGPDQMVTIRDVTQYPAGTQGEHGVAFSGASLNPVNIGILSPALPPLDFILLFPLQTLLGYSIARRRNSARKSISPALTAIYVGLGATVGLRTLLFLLYAIVLVITAAYAMYRWRRELANWVLHLRHPDDERFRLA